MGRPFLGNPYSPEYVDEDEFEVYQIPTPPVDIPGDDEEDDFENDADFEMNNAEDYEYYEYSSVNDEEYDPNFYDDDTDDSDEEAGPPAAPSEGSEPDAFLTDPDSSEANDEEDINVNTQLEDHNEDSD